MKKFNRRLIDSIFGTIKKRKQVKNADADLFFICGDCFRLFPPSFCLFNSKEELEEIIKKEVESSVQLINRLE